MNLDPDPDVRFAEFPARVMDLRPGDLVTKWMRSACYIQSCAHPLFDHPMQLVIWRLDDGSWSHDALLPEQVVGQVHVSTLQERQQRLRAALLGGPAGQCPYCRAML
jgi:hypothetical protein